MRSYLLILFATFVPFAAVADPLPNEMIFVPAGVFIMGDGAAYCGHEEHEVTLTRGFYLGQHEVTNQEYLEALQRAYDLGYVNADTTSVWDNLDGSTEELLDLHGDDECSEIQFDGAGGFYLRESPSGWAQSAYPGGYDPSDHPVKMVTWYGAVRYCDWLSMQAGLPRAYEHQGDWSCNGGDPYAAQGYRLPTDAEWEYAAQFDDERIFPWGGEVPDCSRANFDRYPTGYCVGWTSPVGSYPDAPEALGLSDMAGNIWESCNDWWVCGLGTDPVTDPTGPSSGTLRVLRGGDWWFAIQNHLLCAGRFQDPSMPPHGSWGNVGFRVARTVDESGIDTEPARDRSQLFLDVNQPNPFTGLTRITYSIPNAVAGSPVLLAIYDASGRMVRRLVDTAQPAGSYAVSWDGADNAGEPVEAGAYFYRLTTGDMRETRRLLLIR